MIIVLLYPVLPRKWSQANNIQFATISLLQSVATNNGLQCDHPVLENTLT